MAEEFGQFQPNHVPHDDADRHSPSSDLEIVHEGKFLNFVRRGRWEYVTRCNATNVVAVVAIHDDERIVLVEQFRPPVQAYVIELPAGLVGDEPEAASSGADATGGVVLPSRSGSRVESALDAAQRELLEETGYKASDWAYLLPGLSSGGLTDESVCFFSARRLHRHSPGGGVGSERIRVHEVPLSGLAQWLNTCRGDGKLIDAKLLAGVYAATRF